MDRFIPERLDDLTPEWLTMALRQGGHLPEAGEVVSVEREVLGRARGSWGTSRGCGCPTRAGRGRPR